ncbi:AbiV family abortive infection protein [Bacillus haynesii]|uniref:AbiV family abortive infection protein n=1 Tax=Bacillus haynesii TaxID=1925021 RepID=UPI002280DA6E|nr:AbiV family abortive infection protein [Bacillus haynesii]MCY8074906.1 AbiV family abortive infection protein [Bacillus haynesii]
MSFNQLKLKEIEEIFFKIYENACELIEDAEILYNKERYARAYLCAHIAFEELGKLPMLYTAAIKVYNGIKVDWKNLNKRIRDHKRKISNSYGSIISFNNILKRYSDQIEKKSQNEYTSSMENNKSNFVETVKEFIENNVYFNPDNFQLFSSDLDSEDLTTKYSMTMLLNEYKNGSLYADFDEEIFVKPSEKIDKETCEFGIMIALIQKKYIEMPGNHKNGLHLYEISEELKEKIQLLIQEYKMFDNLI